MERTGAHSSVEVSKVFGVVSETTGLLGPHDVLLSQWLTF